MCNFTNVLLVSMDSVSVADCDGCLSLCCVCVCVCSVHICNFMSLQLVVVHDDYLGVHGVHEGTWLHSRARGDCEDCAAHTDTQSTKHPYQCTGLFLLKQ